MTDAQTMGPEEPLVEQHVLIQDPQSNLRPGGQQIMEAMITVAHCAGLGVLPGHALPEGAQCIATVRIVDAAKRVYHGEFVVDLPDAPPTE